MCVFVCVQTRSHLSVLHNRWLTSKCGLCPVARAGAECLIMKLTAGDKLLVTATSTLALITHLDVCTTYSENALTERVEFALGNKKALTRRARLLVVTESNNF